MAILVLHRSAHRPDTQIPINLQGTQGNGGACGSKKQAIKPLLAVAQGRRKSRAAQNPRPIDKHYETIRTAMQGVFDGKRLTIPTYSAAGFFDGLWG
jgi:hypothetical protein